MMAISDHSNDGEGAGWNMVAGLVHAPGVAPRGELAR